MKIQLLPKAPDSWLTPEGAYRKAQRIKAQGVPDLSNWRFITLTIDRAAGLTAFEAYNLGKQRMQFFSREMERKGLFAGRRWAWKLELHEDGYPHWHLILDHRQKYSKRQLALVSLSWGLGRVNVKRITKKDMSYLFKYAVKCAVTELPKWVLDLRRPRFWQTSGGFYLKKKSVKPSEASEPSGKLWPTEGEKIAKAKRVFRIYFPAVKEWGAEGRLTCDFLQVFEQKVNEGVLPLCRIGLECEEKDFFKNFHDVLDIPNLWDIKDDIESEEPF